MIKVIKMFRRHPTQQSILPLAQFQQMKFRTLPTPPPTSTDKVLKAEKKDKSSLMEIRNKLIA